MLQRVKIETIDRKDKGRTMDEKDGNFYKET